MYEVSQLKQKFEPSNIKFAGVYVGLQLFLVILFAAFVDYAPDASAQDPEAALGVRYAFWQDVHVMVYVGFGFLLTFTGRYSWSSVAFNMFLSAFAWQWSVLCYGFWEKYHEGDWSSPIPLNVDFMIQADFSAATVMVTFSAVLGKLSPLQYLVMAFFEVIFIATNQFIGEKELWASDAGGSMFIHTFGCYFGLALTWALFFRNRTTDPFNHPNNYTSYNSDTFAMIGTLFLWMFWPSFNAAMTSGSAQHRAVINTLVCITASCGMTFALSTLFRGKFGMPEIQNSTLAGGVAMGTASIMMIHPWAAILIGMVAGSISTLGFIYLTPLLERAISLHDTAGINNLHGLPGILGALVGTIGAFCASTEDYGDYIGFVFPKMGPSNATIAAELGLGHHGVDRTAMAQGGMQLAALAVTLVLSIASGLLVGALLRLPFFDPPDRQDQFDDSRWWDEANPPASEHHHNEHSGYEERGSHDHEVHFQQQENQEYLLSHFKYV
eukprot:TRINITY_DN10126_c0_g1_i1.p1 TRINITY_DN10126_c0_g1~~TRINITY_DN10126_c0_g1_i1.p1  ORF type:complete len:511 (-),score=129.31 TRINITY_DN10126_c0_g1_i1:46-1533(-)